MDPKLFKLLKGAVVMSPSNEFDDATGGIGDDDTEGVEDAETEGEDSEEGDEAEGEGEDDEDGADEDGGADEDSEEEDESGDTDEDADFEMLGQRTQKRIKKLVAETKDLRRRLEEAQKLGGEDGKSILSAATKAGLLPRLMTKELAEGLDSLDSKKNALGYISSLLDGDEDDFTIGEKEYTRTQLERKERALTAEVSSLEAKFGSERDKVAEETKALLELGLAAKKAGWKPGKGGDPKKVRKHREEPQNVANRGKIGESKRRIAYGDVEDDASLEAMIAAERSRKKGSR